MVNGKVYGVLVDFDLSSWTSSLSSDCAKASQQRVGTPPYMAHGLLKGVDAIHLYRHDLESLFYTMLILATHYKIVPSGRGKKKEGLQMRRQVGLPFQDWFNEQDYATLGSLKSDFLSSTGNIKLGLSPKFEDFGDWLRALRRAFRCGFIARNTQDDLVDEQAQGRWNGRSGRSVIPPFDDETLGGHVSYSTLINSARNLTGKLEGLIVRYESEPASANTTPTNAIQVLPRVGTVRNCPFLPSTYFFLFNFMYNRST